MQRDDLRLFDLQWDDILLKVTPAPPEEVLETLYQKQLEGCVQLAPTMCLYKLSVAQEVYPPSYAKLKRMVKFYLADAQTKLHEANLLRVKQGLAAQATIDPKDRKKTDCRSWIKSGKCPRNDTCPFKHDPATKGPKAPNQAPKGKGKGKQG